MAHRVRKAMSERDSQYSLADLVDMDETFFGPTGTKRGRESEHKSIVLCAVSIYTNKKKRKKSQVLH